MLFDEMIEREQYEGYPHRCRRRCADPEERDDREAESEHDFEVNRIVGGGTDLPIELLEELDHRVTFALRFARGLPPRQHAKSAPYHPGRY